MRKSAGSAKTAKSAGSAKEWSGVHVLLTGSLTAHGVIP